MGKLEERFGNKELPETSKAKFHQSFQQPEERLEDWADRVTTLATSAFINLPEQYSLQEAISRFCQGCRDKDAGKHACFKQPYSMQDAVNEVRYFQYITKAVEGKKVVKSVRKVNVNAVSKISEDERLDKLEEEMEILAYELREFRLMLNNDTVFNNDSTQEDTETNSLSCNKVEILSPSKTTKNLSKAKCQVSTQNSETICLKEEETVHLVRAGSSSVEITVGEIPVTARVDSGAEITILSSSIYKQLKRKPGKVKDVNMQLADKETLLKGFITNSITIHLGNQVFKERVYVAQISDEMLLGHDILHHLGALLD